MTEQNRKQVELLLQGKIIDTPGHTADSISLLTNDGSLFCGDAAMNGCVTAMATTSSPTRFAFWPITLGREKRWLELVTINQHWSEYHLNLNTNFLTYVEPEWFRQRKIKVIQKEQE